LEARTRYLMLGWCVRLVKSSALIGRNCQGRRVASEVAKCRNGRGHPEGREPTPNSREAISDGSLPTVLPVTSPMEAVRAAIAVELKAK
jgi:hypothetical protein